jgi:hypothetical protein
MIQIEITHKKLSELATDAHALCRQHLLDLRKAADGRGDAAWSTIILEILTQEQRSGVRLITQLSPHGEAIPFQSVSNPYLL